MWRVSRVGVDLYKGGLHCLQPNIDITVPMCADNVLVCVVNVINKTHVVDGTIMWVLVWVHVIIGALCAL